ncbi:CMD domain protein [Rhizobium sp. Leaf262]|uniref:CMD domain protein n=1 Tax=Rhizobium sp. Leaf262 TaxID=1736312 RepID=UPI000714C108|nr:CMD domain protein [Rhizobium sp. Leaf262]KQO83886.1 hypothetical protein ASF29_00365 [Rhizobium sp. Leaf262]
MITTADGDVINTALGLAANSDLAKLRERRAKLQQFTQSSFNAAFHPQDPRNFSYAERAAFALRMANLWNAQELAGQYKALLEKEGSTEALLDIAMPGYKPADETSRLAAILRHIDLVTLSPKEATRENIEKLYAAGLDDRDIVTLAGLIAFVNYQVLVVAGLKMLRDN